MFQDDRGLHLGALAHLIRVDIDLSWVKFGNLGKLHDGFMKALGMQKGKKLPKEIEKASDREQFAY